MQEKNSRFNWVQSGLFWRTFLMLAFLVMTSMAVWFASFRIVERTPKAQQIAAQISSIVTITRAALTHAAPERQRELLFDLASNEGVRIYLLEETDKVEVPDPTPIFNDLKAAILHKLGPNTRFAKRMNGVPGFWVSFEIEEDQYWLRIDQERIEPNSSAQLITWAAATLLLTLIGAAAISKLINEPLARLSAAAQLLAQGKQPEPLPEKGPYEIQETNASFNQMVNDLARNESDRAVILAGISHDLRTPLARMQLEVEMADLPSDARQGMQSDLAQMDSIIGQFLDYAKPLDQIHFEQTNISQMLLQIIEEYVRQNDLVINWSISPDIKINGNPIELRRLINNLIENARRYGKSVGTEVCNLDIQCRHKYGSKRRDFVLSFRDHGAGVETEQLDQLLKPFTRGDVSRSQANGSGLGLAIVDRIVKRHSGRLRIANHLDGGFLVEINFSF